MKIVLILSLFVSLLHAGECERLISQFVKREALMSQDDLIKWTKSLAHERLSISDLKYSEFGKEHDETVVLIHGLDSSEVTFFNITEELSKKYHVITYDQRGHNKSAEGGPNFSNEVMAEDLKMLLDHLHIKKANILGHSMGARTAVKFASLYPERISSIIIEDMEMGARVPLYKLSHDILAGRLEDYKELKQMFWQKKFKSREELTKALEPIYGKDSESLTYRRAKENPDGTFELLFRPWNGIMYSLVGNSEDLVKEYLEIKAPVLVMQASKEKGTAISKEGIKKLALKKEASIHYFENAGHVIHRQDEKEFMKVLKNFLKMSDKKLLTPSIFDLTASEKKELASQMLLPPGSALSTSSGALKKTGITEIIHAATGSMSQNGKLYSPTLKSVGESVKNSIELAIKHDHKRVAVPFIGGAIFLERIGVDAETLALEIVKAVLKNLDEITPVLVTFGEKDTKLFTDIVKQLELDIEVKDGSLVDYNLHKASAIVNAANTEVIFGGQVQANGRHEGGGLSGVIGRTSEAMTFINREAHKQIKLFWKGVK